MADGALERVAAAEEALRVERAARTADRAEVARLETELAAREFEVANRSAAAPVVTTAPGATRRPLTPRARRNWRIAGFVTLALVALGVAGAMTERHGLGAEQRACRGGNARKCAALGADHLAHDQPLRAWIAWRQACDAGDADGCRGLETLAERHVPR